MNGRGSPSHALNDITNAADSSEITESMSALNMSTPYVQQSQPKGVDQIDGYRPLSQNEGYPQLTKFFNHDDPIFQLFLYLFARSVDLKVAQLWNRAVDCLGCCAEKFTSWHCEDKCAHTQKERVEKFFDEAVESNEYFFTDWMQEVCILEGFAIPEPQELGIFKDYCRTVHRSAVRDMIVNGYPDYSLMWRLYFDP